MRLSILLALCVCISPPLPAAQDRAPAVQSVDLAVPVPPIPFRQGDREQLVYELHITNFQPVEIVLNAVVIDDPRGFVTEYRDADLHARLTRPGLRNDHAARQVVAPGMRAIVNIWMPAGNGVFAAGPLRHTVELTVQRPDRPAAVTVTGGETPVMRTAAPPVLDAPLGAGQWVAIYDPLLMGGHRTAIYTLDGRARIPGRFAIDFIRLPQSGALATDRAARQPDANGFGTDVLAVADGTIATAVDGIADHMPQPVPPDVAAGNHVSIDIGGGRFVFYEHLQRGSVRVKTGERVRRGDVIAKLGASGSTSIGAHLHFHVADANATLAAEGMPFVFGTFTTLGEFASIGALMAGQPWQPASLARAVVRSRPAPNAVISFR